MTSAPWIERFLYTRSATEALAAPLTAEDQQLQSMPDCSPTKWHRAHTTWFFEEFVLSPRGVAPLNPKSRYLFNSYYEAVGPRHARPQRGVLSRPSCDEIAAYRREVDARVVRLLESLDAPAMAALAPTMALGIAHEEQHQELLLTDILHAFSLNPLRPAWREGPHPLTPSPKLGEGEKEPNFQRLSPPLPIWERGTGGEADTLRWHRIEGGVHAIGSDGGDGFVFDNESPRHREWVPDVEIASRPVTVGEVMAFIDAGGYRTPSLWLSAAWDWVRAQDVQAPGHARVEGGAMVLFGLDGEREADAHEPAAFVSYYEADAIARFMGARLPTEAEWELAARGAKVDGNFRERGALRPLRAAHGDGLEQLFGDVWEWTRSSYEPYPGYAPAAGALGEYNGKFMVNQRVLRGGSCLSNRAHLRASYRNFWYPETRFQMTGLRLARDVRG